MGKYLLTGFLKCSECGANFIANASLKRNQAYYVCGTRWRRKDGCSNKLYIDHKRMEDQITERIQQTILVPGFIEDYLRCVIEATEKESEKKGKEIGRLERQLVNINSRIRELVDALADRRFPRDIIAEQIEDEQAQKERVEAEITHHKLEIPTLPPSLDAFREDLSDALDDEETKKAAIHGLVRQITIYPDATLEIEYAIKLTNKHMAPRGIEPRFDG